MGGVVVGDTVGETVGVWVVGGVVVGEVVGDTVGERVGDCVVGGVVVGETVGETVGVWVVGGVVVGETVGASDVPQACRLVCAGVPPHDTATVNDLTQSGSPPAVSSACSFHVPTGLSPIMTPNPFASTGRYVPVTGTPLTADDALESKVTVT